MNESSAVYVTTGFTTPDGGDDHDEDEELDQET